MSRRLILVVLTALAGVPLAGAQGTAEEHAPKLVCDEPTYNFGERDSNQAVEHTFILRNEGDLTLEIKNVRAACGCTVANVSTKTLPPGAQAEVSTRLTLQGRTGPQRKSITVESNDPRQQYLTLYLEGTAIAEVDVKPRVLSLGRIRSEATVTGVVEFLVQATNAVKITRFSAGPTNFAADLETVEEGKSYRFVVSSIPPLPQGTLRGNLHIETDYSKYPAMDIPLSAFVAADLMYLPTDMTLVESPGQTVTRFVVIRSEAGKAFDIAGVEFPAPSVQANVQPLPGEGYRVEFTNIVATMDLDGKALLIRTTMPENETIRIPIRVIPNVPKPTPQ